MPPTFADSPPTGINHIVDPEAGETTKGAKAEQWLHHRPVQQHRTQHSPEEDVSEVKSEGSQHLPLVQLPEPWPQEGEQSRYAPAWHRPAGSLLDRWWSERCTGEGAATVATESGTLSILSPTIRTGLHPGPASLSRHLLQKDSDVLPRQSPV